MMVESSRFMGGYYRNTFETLGESEGSGSSGRMEMEGTASEYSSGPTRKSIILNSNELGAFGVPKQVIPSNLSRSERKDLIRKLRLQVGQIQNLLKRADLLRTNGLTVSSSSDILSCSNGNASRPVNIQKSAVSNAGSGKKLHSQGNSSRVLNRGSSGRFESVKQPPVDTANVMLMKQCETLLKRLMSHQYSWVFNTPVDVVKLNIPDYFNVIKHPMDLGTIKTKINSGVYASPLEFAADVRLTFANAMTYNPPGNDVHIMADTLSKYFEVRWKSIEKKLPANEERVPSKSDTCTDREIVKPMPPTKKRKMNSASETVIEPPKRVITEEERHNLGRQLESLIEELPPHIIDFLKKQSSSGMDAGEDEIEIDIDDLSDETLFTLRKLLDEFLQEKQRKESRTEPCEIELRNGSGPSNSSLQNCEGNEMADEDVAVGGNEPPVSDSSSDSSSSDRESDGAKAAKLEDTSTKLVEAGDTEAQLDKRTVSDDHVQGIDSVNVSDQFENPSPEKRSPPEADRAQDGNGAQIERQPSSEKQYRAALLKNRFADIILKAREKTLPQNEKGDPEKLRREREEFELQKKREKARLQAEAKAAEDARRKAEEEAAAEAKRKREREREAARQALLKMEKTVEINENSRFLEDLEMLSSAPADHIPSSADEASPERSVDALGSFKFGGSNPLEQLGLYMKRDEEEEEPEAPAVLNSGNDVEEGEID